MSSLLVSSRLSCISGRSITSSSNKGVNRVLFHEPFPVSIKECQGYTDVLNVSQDYDIYLDSSGLHWYLLIHCKKNNFIIERPYVSLEIVSDSLYSGPMIPTMRIIQADQVKNPSGDTVTRNHEAQVVNIIEGVHQFYHDYDGDCDSVTCSAFGTEVVSIIGCDIGAAIGSMVGKAIGSDTVSSIGAIAGGDIGAAIGGHLLEAAGDATTNIRDIILGGAFHIAIRSSEAFAAVQDALKRGDTVATPITAATLGGTIGGIVFVIAKKLTNCLDLPGFRGACLGSAVAGGAICAARGSGIINPTVSNSLIGAAILGGTISGAMVSYTTGDTRTTCVAAAGGAVGAALGSIDIAGRFYNTTDRLDHKLKDSDLRVEDVMLWFGGLKANRVSTQSMTLLGLCRIAERVRLGMGEYNVLTNNCQHFCNNVLKELGLPPHPTTVGPDTTAVKGIDNMHEVFTMYDTLSDTSSDTSSRSL